MKTYTNPPEKKWEVFCRRPAIDPTLLFPLVQEIFEEVKQKSDKALQEYTLKFDKVEIKDFKVSSREIETAVKSINPALKKAITVAANNIRRFHSSQTEKQKVIETSQGVFCWREARPIEKVGIYIPGGTAPLFSTVLMLGIPAKIAGCSEILLCTPPDKKGNINPAILFAAKVAGITNIYKTGGIQAIAALSIGTKTIPTVDKIFGPGNQYVTAAKQYAQMRGTAIDMPAGPSEVLVIADDFADPSFVAADLLSQAEHGSDSQVVLVCTNKEMVEIVKQETEKQLAQLPRKNIAQQALRNSFAVVFEDLETCIRFSNTYAPEHLILSVKNAGKLTRFIKNAGSVFIGKYSCESAGDYASGTNHTLPTNGNARAYSGVSLDTFLKKITFQELTGKGISRLGPVIEEMAAAEQLLAHKNAVTIRLKSLKK